ncbi:MAG TPA: glycoside hydrolase family 3 C-terminal domain-containing protein [Candidatus Sulfotelmatobacter sp.]|nr:glycoside hydrolase family 3 C-terminal domain-containing protein [Candidatus Sulfotelmatobacter sp.]
MRRRHTQIQTILQLAALLNCMLLRCAAQTGSPVYLDPSQPINVRVDDLVGRMTLEEKASQLVNQARAIPRLQVPAYDWWSEALHGVARAGTATVFPEPIGLAATFDDALIHEMAVVIGTEARAKHDQAVKAGRRDIYEGLDFWSPNINIFRDPRWGRGQETYGEDPFLTARMGVAFITGLQGDDPKYFHVIATAKHFAVHSGPETTRHTVDVQVSKHDEEDTYLPAFRAAITEGKAESVMCAYNRVNGQPACANTFLLQDTLRGAWKFNGYVVSDCDAVVDIFQGHHFAKSQAEATADAIKTGMDNECADYITIVKDVHDYQPFIDAVKQGLLAEADLDVTLKRLFTARMRLGMFDPPSLVPYANTPQSEIDSAPHRALALKTAQESMVLLKNDGVLPFGAGVKKILVVGPLADSAEVLYGNYSGTPSHAVTVLEGVRKQFSGAQVSYQPGTNFLSEKAVNGDPLIAAVSAARQADVVVAVVGITSKLEGEEMKVDVPGFRGGDRTSLNLPAEEEALLGALKGSGKPLVVVLMNGSALAVNWANDHANAILDAWYSGEEGGTAIAQTLAGANNPAGRLPVTFYRGVEQLPEFEDYAMKNRTYRYFTGEPLYGFGHGLSYTTFEYSGMKLSNASLTAGDALDVEIDVKNTGKRDGDEVAELYITFPKLPGAPLRSLRGFTRVHLNTGEQKHVKLTLSPRNLSYVNEAGDRFVATGDYLITIGGGQPGTSAPHAESHLMIQGEQKLPE